MFLGFRSFIKFDLEFYNNVCFYNYPPLKHIKMRYPTNFSLVLPYDIKGKVSWCFRRPTLQ